MPLDIQPVGKDKWVRQLLYSYPGWGKTSLEGTYADLGKMLLIRCSMDQIPSRIVGHPNIDEVIMDTHEKADEILDYCRYSGDFPYNWVWWDNISTAQDKLLDDIWEATVAEKPSRGYILDQETGKRLRPNLTPSSGLDRGEYGRNAERIQQWVRHMVGIRRFHFGIGAHPAEMQHPVNDEGGTILAPWIQVKNMTSKISGYMNIVAFLELIDDDDDPVRRLHVKENSRFYAKDLYDAFLPDGYLDNPTGPEVMKRITKAFGGKMGAGNVTSIAGRRGAQPVRGRRGAARKGA